MKRRTFIKLSSGLSGMAAASHAFALMPFSGIGDGTAPEVTRIRIGFKETSALRMENFRARKAGLPAPWPDPPDDENNYWAEAIRLGDHYFYRVGNTVVPASRHEYSTAIANPSLYYFSMALLLHCRIDHQRKGEPLHL